MPVSFQKLLLNKRTDVRQKTLLFRKTPSKFVWRLMKNIFFYTSKSSKHLKFLFAVGECLKPLIEIQNLSLNFDLHGLKIQN